MTREDVLHYVKKTYGTDPEYLFKSSPKSAVLRHKQGRKWYAVILAVVGTTLGLGTEEEVDVLNVKAEPELVGFLRMQEGMLPAYHMNKEHWISVLLDGTGSHGQICSLLDGSYALTEAPGKKQGRKTIKNTNKKDCKED